MPIGPRRLPFFQHLAELRNRLMIILLTVTVGSLVLYSDIFYWPILEFVFKPIRHLVEYIFVTNPFESFTFRFKISLFAAVVILSPVIIYQILAFLLPALKPKEQKWVIPTIAVAVVLFLSGVVFSYTVVMRPAFEFMFAQAKIVQPVVENAGGIPGIIQTWTTNVQQWFANLLGVSTSTGGGDTGGDSIVGTLPNADTYLTGVLLLLLGFGAAFEVPIVVFYAIGFGLIPYHSLRGSWRYVYTILAIVAAVATPDWSPVTFGLAFGALLVLYEGSLLFARVVFAKRIKARRLEGAGGATLEGIQDAFFRRITEREEPEQES
ncbi:MAG: twin-arginine translocase subunit TatC [Coriobacteriia bacterium]|nr:twin-arginine translocase subunit TatC [Coriobacteriia bacterium]